MNERPQIELAPDRYQAVHDKPLASRRALWASVAIFTLLTALAAYSAWRSGTYWGALLPVLPAALLGVSLAGLFPRYFFRRRTR